MTETTYRISQSESINELAGALAKAQSKLHGAKKDATNPFFKSNYATLESVYEAIREPLAEQGLSVIQPTEFINGQTFVRTVLMHSSGQWIDGLYPVISQKNDPQGLGSGMSYSRRYSLMAMVGIPASDDDAESATVRTTQSHAPTPQAEAKTYGAKTITDKQAKRLFAIAKQKGVSPDNVKGILNKYGWSKSEEITWDKYDEICLLVEAAGFSPEDWERQPDAH